MADAAVATDVHEALDVELDFRAQVTFHLVFVLILDDVDGRSRGVVAFGKPVVAQKIVENARQPDLSSNSHTRKKYSSKNVR